MGIDFRFIVQIKQQLERNSRLREKARPKLYRKRIDGLVECQKEVKVLETTMKRNLVRKRKARIRQAVALQELCDERFKEQKRQQELGGRLDAALGARAQVDEEIEELQA